jgi:hypothetical protein
VLLLVTKSLPEVRAMRVRGERVGRLFTPRMTGAIKQTAAASIPWALDNDAFNGMDISAYLRALGIVGGNPECLFVVLPDVVGDAETTYKNFIRWQPIVREELGLPVAYALQDGLQGVGVPWELTDAVFVGGTTLFKMGEVARRTVAEARERGKWVHMGRVNSSRRAEYAASIGCDSVDGSMWARWVDTYRDQRRAIFSGHRQGTLA